MIVYTCHGAARGVTGSCHLIECGESRILVDCGLFQGDAMPQTPMRTISPSIPDH